MCLGNYDDAQRTINAFGLKSVVGAETVPTTPGVDTKHDLFSKAMLSSINPEHYSGVRERQILPSSKLITATASSSKPSKHEANSSGSHGTAHQRPPYQSQRPPRSSVSPKVNTHLSTVNSSQLSDASITKQTSPVNSKHQVKPVTPRPPSRQESRPKEKKGKEKTHHHHHHHHNVGKEKRPDKDKIKLQQDKVHQKPPKLLSKPAAVKSEQQLSSSEAAQVRHVEPNSLNKIGSGRTAMPPSMPPSKTPYSNSREAAATGVLASSGVTVKPVLPSKIPKLLPSPIMKVPFTGEACVSDSQQSPTKAKPDKNAINASLEINMVSEKKMKEKKLKKKKHKSRTMELPKETEHEDITEFTSEPRMQPMIPSKKPVAQKPTSLDLRLLML